MRVAWYTEDKPSSPSTVRYGVSPGQYTNVVNSTVPPIVYFEDHGYHHVVEVIGLAPSTTYYYVVGGADGGWSKEWHFKTPPSGSAADVASISMAIFGDMGWQDSKQRPMWITRDGLEKHWSATVSRDRLLALQETFDAIWHVGDIGYADDGFAHDPVLFEYEKSYNGFMNWIQDLSAQKPYMVSVGNHESECHGLWCSVTKLKGRQNQLGNFSAYNARWHMPSAESGAHRGSSMWYSWNWGPVHFISINSETDWDGAEERDTGDSHDKKLPAGHFGAPGEYLRWLEDDLKAAAEVRAEALKGGAGQKWIVVGGHRPYRAIQGAHTDLFAKYGVDMYFAGHAHSYTRSSPVNGTVLVVAGGAGCDEMAIPSDDDHQVRTCSEETERDQRQGRCKPGYTAPEGTEEFFTDRMAIGILHADADRLRWQLYDSVNGSILDEVNITARQDSLVI
eukprot:TRINITY_DN25432_c0_g2_i1.p1 TRINITY_DN25432_c0_g2~~TRINITY_DN25432_c0_g2_i1.p1  ORF type:complete len:503 (+),score=78.67 TRINITY_DN25432_c0_g2_i1:160-1509(+)